MQISSVAASPVLESSEVRSFLQTATHFIQLLHRTDLSLKEVLWESKYLLAHLYAQGMDLPEIESMENHSYIDAEPDGLADPSSWPLLEKLEAAENYADMPISMVPSLYAVKVLQESFIHIYQELSRALSVIQAGTLYAAEAALWRLRSGLTGSWGTQAMRAMKTLHELH